MFLLECCTAREGVWEASGAAGLKRKSLESREAQEAGVCKAQCPLRTMGHRPAPTLPASVLIMGLLERIS